MLSIPDMTPSSWPTTVDYDAIILNAFLPDMTSLSLVNLLRKERYPAVIFLLSPEAQEQGQLEAFNAGADDFLVKPSLREMVARLHIHLRPSADLGRGHINPTELVQDDLRGESAHPARRVRPAKKST